MALGDLERLLLSGAAAVVLDIVPTLSVRLAAEVSRRRLAHVVLVLPRWPHAAAVLPVGYVLGTLVETARWLAVPEPGATSVVFVLDGERQTSVVRPAADRRVDNRYALSAADLPSLRHLREAGITRVIRVTRQP